MGNRKGVAVPACGCNVMSLKVIFYLLLFLLTYANQELKELVHFQLVAGIIFKVSSTWKI